jgi:phage gp46-like protein
MITDLRLSKSPGGYLDWSIKDKSLETVDGLQTAIDVSIVSDQRASDTQVSDPSKARGFIGDVVRGFLFGSLLWLLEQSQANTKTANAGEDHIRNGLFWMIEDGLATTIDVESEISAQGIAWPIIIATPSGGRISRTVKLWRNTIELS